MSDAIKHVTVISPRTGQPIAAAHHYRGRLGGYAVHGSANRIELGDRAFQAQETEYDARDDVKARRAAAWKELMSRKVQADVLAGDPF